MKLVPDMLLNSKKSPVAMFWGEIFTEGLGIPVILDVPTKNGAVKVTVFAPALPVPSPAESEKITADCSVLDGKLAVYPACSTLTFWEGISVLNFNLNLKPLNKMSKFLWRLLKYI